MDDVTLTLYRSFSCAIAGMMLYQFVWNFAIYKKAPQKWILNQVLLCASAFLYGFSSFLYTFHYDNPTITHTIAMILPFTGFLAFYHYLLVMEGLLETKVPYRRFIKMFVFGSIGIIGLSYIELTFFRTNFFVVKTNTADIESIMLKQHDYIYQLAGPNMVSLGILTLIGILTAIYFLKEIHHQKSHPILIFGVFLNLVFIVNDIIFGVTFFKYGYIFSTAAYSIEISLITYLVTTHLSKRNLELEHKVAEVSKVAEVGALTGQICHDIRNPLAIILSYSDRMERRLLRLGAKESTTELVWIRRIQEMSDNIRDVISEYLKLMRKDEDGETIISVQTICDEALKITDSKIKRYHVEVQIDIPESLSIRAHHTRLVMILANLITNSCEAIGNKNEKWIRIKATRSKYDIRLVITDSGKGIPEDQKEEIFKALYTTKGSFEGTGLGLNFVRTVMEIYGGNIEVNSESSNTEFVLTFPNRAGEPMQKVTNSGKKAI